MNFLVYALLPLDDIDCWPLVAICGVFIMVVAIGAQLVFNPEARAKRKIEAVKRDLDPSYWGSYKP